MGPYQRNRFLCRTWTRSPSRKIVPLRVSWRHLTGCTRGLSNGILDENSLDALLDGRTESSGVSVAFKNIASIKSLGNSSLVTLHSGRELYMWGENDVNATNRGIAINLPSVGQVIVGWHDFKLFRSIPLDQLNLPVYDDFAGSRNVCPGGWKHGTDDRWKGCWCMISMRPWISNYWTAEREYILPCTFQVCAGDRT